MSATPARRRCGISLYDDGEAVRRLIIKKYGAGKSFVGMTGPAEYVEVAAECLLRAFQTVAYIDKEFFRKRMRERGVPETVIDGFLQDAWVTDESYLEERY